MCVGVCVCVCVCSLVFFVNLLLDSSSQLNVDYKYIVGFNHDGEEWLFNLHLTLVVFCVMNCGRGCFSQWTAAASCELISLSVCLMCRA